MKNIVCIQIPYWESSLSKFDLRGLGLALKHQVEKSGAKCLAVWADSTLTITVEGAALPLVETLLNAFFESIRKNGGKLSMVQRDVEQFPGGTLADLTT
jgi:hypothetical protein